MSLFRKFATAFLSLAIIVFGALQAAIADGLTGVEIGQLAALFFAGIVTFVLPLVDDIKWQGMLKTGFAILGAVAVLLIPLLIDGGLTAETGLVVLMAGLNVAATELGVYIRTTKLLDARETNVVTALSDSDSALIRAATVPAEHPKPSASEW